MDHYEFFTDCRYQSFEMEIIKLFLGRIGWFLPILKITISSIRFIPSLKLFSFIKMRFLKHLCIQVCTSKTTTVLSLKCAYLMKNYYQPDHIIFRRYTLLTLMENLYKPIIIMFCLIYNKSTNTNDSVKCLSFMSERFWVRFVASDDHCFIFLSYFKLHFWYYKNKLN